MWSMSKYISNKYVSWRKVMEMQLMTHWMAKVIWNLISPDVINEQMYISNKHSLASLWEKTNGLWKLRQSKLTSSSQFKAMALLIWMDQSTLVQFKTWLSSHPWLYSWKYGISVSLSLATSCRKKMTQMPVDDTLNGQGDLESDKRRMMKSSQSHDDIGKLKRSFSGVPVLKTLQPENATVGATICLGKMREVHINIAPCNSNVFWITRCRVLNGELYV